jgi:hypothetical protein
MRNKQGYTLPCLIVYHTVSRYQVYRGKNHLKTEKFQNPKYKIQTNNKFQLINDWLFCPLEFGIWFLAFSFYAGPPSRLGRGVHIKREGVALPQVPRQSPAAEQDYTFINGGLQGKGKIQNPMKV